MEWLLQVEMSLTRTSRVPRSHLAPTTQVPNRRRGKGSRRAPSGRSSASASILGVPVRDSKLVQVPAAPRWAHTRTRLTQSTANAWNTTVSLAITSSLTSLSASGEWANLANSFDQFRIHAISVKVPFPDMAVWAAYGVTGGPSTVIAAYDNDEQATTKSYAAILAYGTHTTSTPSGMLDFRIRLPVHMVQPGVGDGVFESPWIDVASVSSLMGQVMIALDALVVGPLSGIFTSLPIIVDYDVEFRARQ